MHKTEMSQNANASACSAMSAYTKTFAACGTPCWPSTSNGTRLAQISSFAAAAPAKTEEIVTVKSNVFAAHVCTGRGRTLGAGERHLFMPTNHSNR